MVFELFLPLAQHSAKFVSAPGREEAEAAGRAGEASVRVIWEGAATYLNSGLMTLLVLPVLAVALYRLGFRIAGPLLGLFTLGLFLARMFNAPA
jgi:hypothetical protein